ncbi:MAG: nucleotidyltransferase family protein [Victivallales bacterium]|nr:nucleotidyltransferase family protein [Victivallales bacterium]
MGVKTIGFFGSVARGDDSPASDYDILVEFDENHHKYKYFNQLCDFIEKYVGNNYDLVTRQGLSPYMGEKILDEVEYVEIAS